LVAVAAAAIAAIFLVRRWSWNHRLQKAMLLVGIVGMFWSPWLARNLAVQGQFVFTTDVWRDVWAGANSNATGSDRLPLTPERKVDWRRAALSEPADAESVGTPRTQLDLLGSRQRDALRFPATQPTLAPEAMREAQFRDWAKDYLRTNVAAWLRQADDRAGKLFLLDWDHPLSHAPGLWAGRVALAMLCVIGLCVAVWRRLPVGGTVAVVLGLMIYHTLTVANVKSTLIVEPIQGCLAIAALAPLIWRAGTRTRPGDEAS
jgi:hypothetical protein